MEQIRTNVRKWGNSFGVVIPMGIVEKENLKDGTEVTFTIQQKKVLKVRDLMEFAKKLNLPKSMKSTEEIMREIDKDLYGISR